MHLRRIWLVSAFVMINLFLNSWFLDNSPNGNSMSRAAMVSSLVHHRSFQIDPYHEGMIDKALIDGHYYSEKAPLPALLVTPVYWLLVNVGIMESSGDVVRPKLLQLGGFVCGSVPLVLIMLLCWRTTGRSILFCTLPFYASFLFVYSGTFYNHLLAASFALVALLFLKRKDPFLAGLFAGAAFLSEYTMLLLALIWIGQKLLEKNWAVTTRLILGLAPAVIGCLVYNHMITGQAFTFPYHYHASFDQMAQEYGFGWPGISSLYGLTLSPYRGLFFYAPVLLLLFTLVNRTTRSARFLKKIFMDPLLSPAILLFFLMTMYGFWGGGWSYGPRFLTVTAVFLFYFLINKIDFERSRSFFWPLVGFGLTCAFAAKFTKWYNLPSELQNPMIEMILPKIYIGWWTERLGLGSYFGEGGWNAFYFILFFITSMVFLKVMECRTLLRT